MNLARTRALLPRVEWRPVVGSTNAELRALALGGAEAAPHGTLVAAAEQTAGRGRAGRGWETPPGTALAMSVLIRGFGHDREALPLGWLPLLAGSAVTATLQPLFGAGLRVGTKWPNDVHVRDEGDAEAGRPGRKLCGILCEVVPGGPAGEAGEPSPAVVVGIGINVLIPEWRLPTERSTSLLAAGAEVPRLETFDGPGGAELVDGLLAGISGELLRLVALAEADPGAARARVLRHSLTLGAEVRVHLPGDEVVDGRAVALADGGELVVDLPTGGRLTVSAADVEHLR